MLESTKNLLFRSTTLSASFKKFSINQPRSLSPRESKQLLNILTNSFRQQLDREHGHVFRPEDDGYSSAKRLRRTSTSKTPTGAALPNILIHSILTNPLLSNATHKTTKHLQPRDPIEIFDDAQAKGFMSYELATKCLEAKKSQIVQSSELSIRDGIEAAGLGRKTLRCLLSTGAAQDFPLCVKGDSQRREFLRIFLEFLVAENLQAGIWPWIERCVRWTMSELPHRQTHQPRALEDMVRYFVRAETSTVSLESGLATLIATSKILKEFEYPGSTRLVLRRAAGSLLRETMRRASEDSPSNHASPSIENYESFIELVSSWDCPLAAARLWLEHPTAPNVSYAIEFLKNSHHPVLETNLTPQDRFFDCGLQHVAMLGVATARRLLETDNQTEALRIIDILHENYAEILGVDQKKAVEQAKAEAASLELLDNLQLA